jgi:hypothetical protein
MPIERGRSNEQERRILLAAITSTNFLARVASRVGKEPLRSRFGNLIWRWCEVHVAKYRVAPKEKIETLFAEWARSNSDKDLHASVSRLLSQLSGQYDKETEESDTSFLLDLAENLFNEIRLERFQEDLANKLESGELSPALQLVQEFPRLNLRTQPRIDILRDEEAQKKALEEKQRVLVRYSGAAGEFFGEELAEDSFVAFMAPPKSAKSFTLQDIAWHAMKQGRRVAYFQVGDLSFNQVMRRFQKRALRRPQNKGTIRYPISMVLPEGHRELAMVEHEERVFAEDADWSLAEKRLRSIADKTKGSINLSYHPTKTISAAGVQAVLRGWDEEGHIANVVCVDYAGNLASENGKADFVHQTTETWATLRQISEMRKCLVVTAQQSNKEGFSSWVLSRKHFSESKMILAHVTAFLGINATDEEKGRGIIRYNYVCARERDFRESFCLYTAGCLAIANPIVLSCLPERRHQ